MRAELNKLKYSPFAAVCALVFFIVLSIALVTQMYDNWQLHTYGIAATASVTDIRKTASTGPPRITYQFPAADPSGNTYLYTGYDYLPGPQANNLTPGDQVVIHYDPTNPAHSRLESAAVVDLGILLACPGLLIILGGLASLIMLGVRYIRKRRPV